MKRVPNNIFEHFYNKLTYNKTISNANIISNNVDAKNLTPIWITGLFRSGTSITARLINQMGVDLGPESDLLKARGIREPLNPNGFFENYLFMDWSLMVFDKLNAWGDNPPNLQQVKAFNNDSISYKDFVYNSIVNIHDDRISNKEKSEVLKKYFSGNLDQYLIDTFESKFAIKNPHFCVLYPLLDKLFPNGKYLVVFRNPSDTIKSALQVSPKANYELYQQYYTDIIHHQNAIFLDYDQLISTPEKSIEALSKKLNLSCNSKELSSIINRKEQTIKTNNAPKELLDLYKQLKEKALNK